MSPSADQVNALEIREAVSETLLQDGEEVILAVKPSGWYVLLVSWPVLVVAAAAAVASGVLRFAGPHQAVPLVCAAAGCLRVLVACCQWIGILYVLTNRRVMRVRGLLQADARSCELAKITEVAISAGTLEGALGLGSLLFRQALDLEGQGQAGDGCLEACWSNVARPADLQEAVQSAIGRLP